MRDRISCRGILDMSMSSMEIRPEDISTIRKRLIMSDVLPLGFVSWLFELELGLRIGCMR